LLALGVDLPDDREQSFPLSESTLEAITRGMWGVVNEGEGTGGSARCPGIDIAGKTGTAQVVSVELQKSERNASFKNNAWFVGFAPSSKPEIVVAALVMQGEHSTVAAPLAREVIKAYFDKKTAQKPPLVQTQNQVRMLSKAIEVQSTRPAKLAEFR
jgi:penicillin-binding protein 2